jgi:hypothetical protein
VEIFSFLSLLDLLRLGEVSRGINELTKSKKVSYQYKCLIYRHNEIHSTSLYSTVYVSIQRRTVYLVVSID